MQSKPLYEKEGLRAFVLAFETGDKVMEGLRHFAREHDVSAAHLTGIGAFSQARLGLYDPEKKGYEEVPVEEQTEVLTLVGNIARYEGAPRLHVHVVLGRGGDGAALGGHLLEARVRPTLEVMLTETPAHLERAMDEASGLPLFRL